jgi:PAS domain S-box-containing protein
MFSFEVLDSIIIGFLLFNLIGACGLAYRNYNRKFNLLYLALVCAILGFFICDLFFQSKRIYSIADFIIFEKGTNFFLLIVGIVLIQIVSTVTGYSKKWLNWCFTLPLIYFIIINAIWPYGFYYSNIEKIEMVQLVGGVLFNTAVGGTTINVAFISLYFILLGILVIRSTVFAFKRGIKSGGIILSAAFIPGIIFQFLSAVAFLMSGKINLVAILLSEFGLFYVTLLFGAKNFSDALDLVGATNSLVESEGRYRLLADHMTDTIWLMDMNLHPFYISPSVEKIRGYSIKELLEMPLDKHFTPSSLARAMDAYKKEMDYLKANPGHTFVVTLELEFCRKNGSTYWVENTFSLIRDSNGSPKAILAEGRDITFRKIADAKITQLSRAVEQSPVSIAIVNNEGVIIYANKKIAEEYENMPGVTTGERIYLLNLEVETENDLDIGMILKKGLEWQGEIHHGKSHGVIVWENVTISPIKD